MTDDKKVALNLARNCFDCAVLVKGNALVSRVLESAGEMLQSLARSDQPATGNTFADGLEAAAKEAEHWQKISGTNHKCGEYIAGAIRALAQPAEEARITPTGVVTAAMIAADRREGESLWDTKARLQAAESVRILGNGDHGKTIARSNLAKKKP